MKRAQVIKYCLAKPGAYLDHPWGPDDSVAKVGGKIFCFFGGPENARAATVTVKNTADVIEQWRARHPDHIGPAPYLSKSLWNRVDTGGAGAPDDDDVRELIDDSYALIVSKLRKADRPAQ